MIKLGIAQSPEGRKSFPRMSVLENLEMGEHHRTDRSEPQRDMDRVYDLFPRLERRAKRGAPRTTSIMS